MQTKLIELKQAPVILVEIPKGCKHENLLGKIGDVTFLFWDSTNKFDDDNRSHGLILIDTEPRNRWRILGVLSDLTEEQFAECAIVFNQINEDIGYANYIMGPGEYSAKGFFYFLLESEDVHTKGNPLDKVAKSVGHGTLDNFDQDYQEAQQRTIDPKRTVVLLRKGEKKS